MNRSFRCLPAAVLAATLLWLPPAWAEARQAKPVPRAGAKAAAAPQKPAGMSNQDVIDMVAGGLSEQLVIASIRRTSNHGFDLSPQGLIALKKAGVSETIISVMMDPSAPPAPPAASGRTPVREPAPPVALRSGGTSSSDPADPSAPHPPGIYVDLGPDGGGLVQLEPSGYSGGKTGGVFKSIITAGIVKAKWKAELRGPRANQRIAMPSPAFYFYFEVANAGLSNQGAFPGMGVPATSANEFVFARFKATRSGRELIVGEIGSYGASTGTRSKDTIDVKTEKLAPGIYRVTPILAMEPGEYCIFHAGTISAVGPGGGGTLGRLFDFGVDPR